MSKNREALKSIIVGLSTDGRYLVGCAIQTILCKIMLQNQSSGSTKFLSLLLLSSGPVMFSVIRRKIFHWDRSQLLPGLSCGILWMLYQYLHKELLLRKLPIGTASLADFVKPFIGVCLSFCFASFTKSQLSWTLLSLVALLISITLELNSLPRGTLYTIGEKIAVVVGAISAALCYLLVMTHIVMRLKVCRKQKISEWCCLNAFAVSCFVFSLIGYVSAANFKPELPDSTGKLIAVFLVLAAMHQAAIHFNLWNSGIKQSLIRGVLVKACRPLVIVLVQAVVAFDVRNNRIRDSRFWISLFFALGSLLCQQKALSSTADRAHMRKIDLSVVDTETKKNY